MKRMDSPARPLSTELHSGTSGGKKKKGKGKKKNKHRSNSTTPLNPQHTDFTTGHAATLNTTKDPCTSSHLGYCIHGKCKSIEGLQEPVCM